MQTPYLAGYTPRGGDTHHAHKDQGYSLCGVQITVFDPAVPFRTDDGYACRRCVRACGLLEGATLHGEPVTVEAAAAYIAEQGADFLPAVPTPAALPPLPANALELLESAAVLTQKRYTRLGLPEKGAEKVAELRVIAAHVRRLMEQP